MTVIRDMTEADLGQVSALAEQLVTMHHGWDSTRFFTTSDVAQGYRRFFEQQLRVPTVVLLTAETDGALGGYLYGTLERRDWAKLLDAHGAIHDVFVAKTHRRQGLGHALLNGARARFTALGAQQLVLYSASSNLEGQALFRQLGYRPTMVEMTLDLSISKV